MNEREAHSAIVAPAGTWWQPAGKQMRLESSGGAPAEVLRFEFKTKPVEAPDGKSKAHDHPHE